MEGHAERQATDDLNLAGRAKAKRSDVSSPSHHQVGAEVQVGPQSLKVASVSVESDPLKPKFDRNAYQREYMRGWRKRQAERRGK